jgi:hypothetical protein
MASKNTRTTSPDEEFFNELVPSNRPNNQTLLPAKAQKTETVRELRRHGDERAKRLASILQHCSMRGPCRNSACPVCDGVVVNPQLRRLTFRFLRKQSKVQSLAMITIELPSAVAQIGVLDLFNTANLKRRFMRLFDQAKVGWFIGYLGYSVNSDKDARYQRHWSIYLRGFMITDDAKDLQACVVKDIKKTDAAPKLTITPWDGDKQAIRDTFTTKASLPPGTNQAARFNPKSEKIKASRVVKREQLLASEMAELAVHLHDIGWLERLVPRRIRLWKSGTNPRFKL